MPGNGHVCIVCGKPCTGKRRKFCSHACYRAEQREANRGWHTRNAHVRRRLNTPTAAMRECQVCHKPFLSEGNWNRTCPPCKSRQATVPARARAHAVLGLGPYIEHLDGDGFEHGGGRV